MVRRIVRLTSRLTTFEAMEFSTVTVEEVVVVRVVLVRSV